jgi:hypothetical protein
MHQGVAEAVAMEIFVDAVNWVVAYAKGMRKASAVQCAGYI